MLTRAVLVVRDCDGRPIDSSAARLRCGPLRRDRWPRNRSTIRRPVVVVGGPPARVRRDRTRSRARCARRSARRARLRARGAASCAGNPRTARRRASRYRRSTALRALRRGASTDRARTWRDRAKHHVGSSPRTNPSIEPPSKVTCPSSARRARSTGIETFLLMPKMSTKARRTKRTSASRASLRMSRLSGPASLLFRVERIDCNGCAKGELIVRAVERSRAVISPI